MHDWIVHNIKGVSKHFSENG